MAWELLFEATIALFAVAVEGGSDVEAAAGSKRLLSNLPGKCVYVYPELRAEWGS